MVDIRREKLEHFQAITGLDDSDLCTEILAAHGWDLELAVASFTSGEEPSSPSNTSSTHLTTTTTTPLQWQPSNLDEPYRVVQRSESSSLVALAPNLVWRLVTLPISVISGGLGLVAGAVGLGMWAAGTVLSHSFGMLGLGLGLGSGSGSSASIRPGVSSNPLIFASSAAAEAAAFVAAFERDFAGSAADRSSSSPRFVAEGFMDALQRSRHAYKLLFVYLDSPDHPDTPLFCETTLCNDVLAAFVNENFVAWGGSIRSSEDFKMSNSFKASRFPFCAVVMATPNQRIVLLQQVEGPRSPEEMLMMLQRVLEEVSPVLTSARLEAEERRNNIRLREEQDAAYRAALEADQARERQRNEEQERLEREASEAERKRREEEEARERAIREAAEREADLARRRQEKALVLGAEPEKKGPNVTRVLVRFPTGERKERRFDSGATIQAIYDYVDSLDCLHTEDYSLISNFPRTVYGQDKLMLTLKEAGLHPQASLFVEPNA